MNVQGYILRALYVIFRNLGIFLLTCYENWMAFKQKTDQISSGLQNVFRLEGGVQTGEVQFQKPRDYLGSYFGIPGERQGGLGWGDSSQDIEEKMNLGSKNYQT